MQRLRDERLAQLGFIGEGGANCGNRAWHAEIMAQSLERATQPGALFSPRSAARHDDPGPGLLPGDFGRTDGAHQGDYCAFRLSGFFARFRRPQDDDDDRTPPRPVFDADYDAKVNEAKANLTRTAQNLMRGRVVGLDDALLPGLTDDHSKRIRE